MAAERGAGRFRMRRAISVVLAIVTAVLVLGAVPASVVRYQLVNTEGYVQTVAPLAADPVIQDELVLRVTNRIVEEVNVENVAREALTELSRAVPSAEPLVEELAPVIAAQSTQRISAAAQRVVTSSEFQEVWTVINREAHQRFLGLITGEPTGAARLEDNGALVISTGEIVERVKARLVQEGVPVAARIPPIDAEVTVLYVPELVSVGRVVDALDRGAVLLIGLSALAGISTLVVAPRGARVRAGGILALGIAGAMLLLALGTALGRNYLLGAVPPDRVTPAAVETLVDSLLGPLHTVLAIVLIAAVASLLAAVLAVRFSGDGRPAAA